MNTKETKEQILERVKNEFAQGFGYINWRHYCVCGRIHSNDIDKISEAYRIECNKQMAPSDEEIVSHIAKTCEKITEKGILYSNGFVIGAKWMRDHFINSKKTIVGCANGNICDCSVSNETCQYPIYKQ